MDLESDIAHFAKWSCIHMEGAQPFAMNRDLWRRVCTPFFFPYYYLKSMARELAQFYSLKYEFIEKYRRLFEFISYRFSTILIVDGLFAALID
jgi:hypothetical protein